jgi:hypothetical protein
MNLSFLMVFCRKDDKYFFPTVYTLAQNYPDSFNPSTTIRYSLPATSRVSLQIYNILGQQIADLVNCHRKKENSLIHFC